MRMFQANLHRNAYRPDAHLGCYASWVLAVDSFEFRVSNKRLTVARANAYYTQPLSTTCTSTNALCLRAWRDGLKTNLYFSFRSLGFAILFFSPRVFC